MTTERLRHERLGGNTMGSPRSPLERIVSQQHELLERVQRSSRELSEHRTTHVVWRDWLAADATREKVNPHCGDAEFHAGCVADYDRHLAVLADVADLLDLLDMLANA